MKPLPQCPRCQALLPENYFNQPEVAPCPACQTPIQLEIFPAWFRPASVGQKGEILLEDGAASCFFHPQKKAAAPCDGCGRFLCSLCDCEVRGQHFCPACLEAGTNRGKIKNLENERTLYGGMALALAILPILVFYVTIFTAPMALFITFRYWNAPGSLVSPNKAKTYFTLAAMIAGVEIAGWVVFFTYLANRHHHT